MSVTLLELIEMHRSFLHEIASPLMVAQGTLDQLLTKLDENDIDKTVIKEKIARATNSMNKISEKFKAYRKIIIDLQDQLPKEG